jgi:hypothetical protein
MPTGKEADAGKYQTLVGDKYVPKKPNLSQKLTQQKKGGVLKKGTHAGKKDTT